MSDGPRKDVFTVVERNNRSFWIKIGAAFTNRDGSMSVMLDALPVNGKLQIREPRSEFTGPPRSAVGREPVKEAAPSDFEGLGDDDIPF